MENSAALANGASKGTHGHPAGRLPLYQAPKTSAAPLLSVRRFDHTEMLGHNSVSRTLTFSPSALSPHASKYSFSGVRGLELDDTYDGTHGRWGPVQPPAPPMPTKESIDAKPPKPTVSPPTELVCKPGDALTPVCLQRKCQQINDVDGLVYVVRFKVFALLSLQTVEHRVFELFESCFFLSPNGARVIFLRSDPGGTFFGPS